MHCAAVVSPIKAAFLRRTVSINIKGNTSTDIPDTLLIGEMGGIMHDPLCNSQ
jgi:hypothetical protein